MEKQELNERLEAVREQLEAAAVEVGEITNAAPYGFGSRVSYVIDRIKQAIEDLNTCIDYPPYSWRIEENDRENTVTVWEDFTGFGFRWDKGDILAFYRFMVLAPQGALSSVEGMQKLDRVRAEFLKYARANYPEEFKKRLK